jgi:transketolase
MFASGRAFEQIRNSIAYPKLNVKICASHAGITVGPDGATHQCLEDIGIMRMLPNMTIINPADAVEARLAIKAAAEINGPVYMRFGRSAVPVVFDENYKFEIGKAAVLKEGTDVTIIASGITVEMALKAYELLEAEGISARIVNMATIKPIDADAIVESAKKTGCIVTCEEHNIIGGLGSAVAEVLCEKCPVPMVRVGVADKFGRSGSVEDLLERYKLTPAEIVAKAKEAVALKA